MIYHGESFTLHAVVQYRSGPGAPETVAWDIPDQSVADLRLVDTGEAIVEGVGPGATHVIATINTDFVDSTAVVVTALTAYLEPEDSSVYIGDSLTVQAIVEGRSGPETPDTIVWAASDSSVIELSEVGPGELKVRSLARGTSWVIALINDYYADSALVTIDSVGDIRWRVEGVGDRTWSGASLDASGRIYTVQNGPDMLSAVTPDGDVAYTVSGDWADLSGNVLPNGTAYANGGLYVQRNSPSGALDWQVTCGTSHSGIAIDSSGYVACARWQTDSLYWISPTGAEVWRAPIGYPGQPLGNLLEWRSAPVIAENGDIYIAWTSESPRQFWLSRFSSAGDPLWTVPSANEVDHAAPALYDDRIVVTHEWGHLTVYDTTGAIVWERDWNASVETASPVVDGQGNIYVLSYLDLRSYDAGGALRWAADSLGSSRPRGKGAPTLLSDGSLLATCDDPQTVMEVLCAVDGSDGSLLWRRRFEDHVRGSPAVGADGTIYVTVGDDLLALWGFTPPMTDGWPTAGGGMGRMRSRN
jgi:hypothetical protein